MTERIWKVVSDTLRRTQILCVALSQRSTMRFRTIIVTTLIVITTAGLGQAVPADAAPRRGTIQIDGVAKLAQPGECTAYSPAESPFILLMAGSLVGCWYSFPEEWTRKVRA